MSACYTVIIPCWNSCIFLFLLKAEIKNASRSPETIPLNDVYIFIAQKLTDFIENLPPEIETRLYRAPRYTVHFSFPPRSTV